jgi:hypothetical protein
MELDKLVWARMAPTKGPNPVRDALRFAATSMIPIISKAVFIREGACCLFLAICVVIADTPAFFSITKLSLDASVLIRSYDFFTF